MEMNYSDKKGVRVLMDLFEEKGVRQFVMSPGSRNAPFLFSFSRNPSFKRYMIADERSAGFFALGLALASDEPVGLVCTSGTAMLNYAPAVAEAFYRGVPLIVVTADRPPEWLGQDEGQTIRQEGAMDGFVKSSCSMRAEPETDAEIWYMNRRLNEVLNEALMSWRGPVHINMSFCEPLYGVLPAISGKERNITVFERDMMLSEADWQLLTDIFLRMPKVMLIAGFHSPSEELSRALSAIAALPHVAVFAESISNTAVDAAVYTVDRVLSVAGEDEVFVPDLVISFGGALVSRMLKTFIRRRKPVEHWVIDERLPAPDTFGALTRHIRMDASAFWKVFAMRLKGREPRSLLSGGKTYSALWADVQNRASVLHRTFMSETIWSDLKAFELILSHIPSDVALHVGNSTPVRYLQLFEHTHYAGGEWSNRGTSGIEGATSTALGFSAVYRGLSLLITGDLSFMYDSNALWMSYVSQKMRVIVMRNGGGGIFRFIPGPDSLAELESCFEMPLDVPVEGLAGVYGWGYLKASSAEELEAVLPAFFAPTDKGIILEVQTPRLENASVLRNYFRYLSGNPYPVN